MFNGIKTFIQNTRIKFDYPNFENEQRLAYLALAESRFDTRRLRSEISEINRQAANAGDLQCKASIEALQLQIAATERDHQKGLQTLSLLERNYKVELDELYAQKKSLLEVQETLLNESKILKDEHSKALDERQQAYSELDKAKLKVDQWHSKSKRGPLLFGNGGNKLPDHSIFGQSHGDLSEAKHQRESAAHNVGNLKRRTESIKDKLTAYKEKLSINFSDVGRLTEKISQVKASRQCMYELMAEGVDPAQVRDRVQALQTLLSNLGEDLRSVKSQQYAVVREKQMHLGLLDREADVAKLIAAKETYLKEFDSVQSKENRLEAHRVEWLAKQR